MKKLLGLFMVLALAIPASADVLKNVDLVGEIETIASDVHHDTTPARYNNNVNTRVLAGLSANLVEDVTANVLFQYVTAWDGALQGDRINDGTASYYERNIEIANANVVLSNLFDCFEATIGRQFYGDEDSAVMYIGPNHYNAENFGYAPSLDAAKLTYSDDVKAVTFIAGKVPAGLNAVTPNVNGTKLFGADFRMNVTDAVKLQAYIYDFQKVTVFNQDGDVDKYAGLYGAKLSFNPEAVLVSVEYARNFGGDRLIKEHNDTGYMWKVDAKVDMDEFAVRGAFLYEKETFVSWGNYAPGLLIGHNLATLAFGGINAYSGEGIRMFNVGVDVKPFEKWTFALDGFSFQDRTGEDASTWEGDLTAKYQHNEYVQLFAGLGYAKYHNAAPMAWKTAFNKDNFKWQLGMFINF